jgi:hypothetical protein
MARTTGYLANVLNVPPLIFRFQFNPELLSEKKSFGYRDVNNFGAWKFDKTAGTTGLADVTSFIDDIKEFGSLLVATKALEADVGAARTFALDFALDARAVSDLPEDPDRRILREPDNRFGGRIEPDLAVLRSFMNPSWDPIDDILGWLSGKFCPPQRPPTCDLKLGGIDLTCVMTDLNIKITNFKDDLTPERAEVSVTLKEQTHSLATSLDTIGRLVEVAKSYGNLTGDDWVQALPAAGVVQNIFEL